MKRLRPGAVIWCPFDTADSAYVKVFSRNGFRVIYGHIQTGQDFFQTDTPDCDYIISNPMKCWNGFMPLESPLPCLWVGTAVAGVSGRKGGRPVDLPPFRGNLLHHLLIGAVSEMGHSSSSGSS